MRARAFLIPLLVTMLVSAWPTSSPAQGVLEVAFGPRKYTRAAGRPEGVVETFQRCGTGQCRIVVSNGDGDEAHRVSSAVVLLNGVVIVGPDDFNQQVHTIIRPVVLAEENELIVELRSRPGSFLTIDVQCTSPTSMAADAAGANPLSPTTLAAVVQIENRGPAPAANVQVNSVELPGAALTVPATLPIGLGTIPANAAVNLPLEFAGGPFTPGTTYSLTLEGTYLVGAAVGCFTLSVELPVPPAEPGSAVLESVAIPSGVVAGGGFPPPPPPPPLGEVNRPRWVVPAGPLVAGVPTPSATGTQTPTAEAEKEAGISIVFTGNRGLGINGNPIAEPSGASGGGVVFVAANSFAAFSTNDGASFTQLNPGTIFPNDGIGFCCDQIVQYVPSIDRFIWLLQGNAPPAYRLAVASPAAIINSNGTAWTYWNLRPTLFGQPTGTGFDYPDLSVGNNFLYLSWDAGFGCPTGCTWGLQVARTSLAGLQAGGTITIEFTNPANGQTAWGSHVMQDTGDEIFWAGHTSNSRMRIFSLAEGSNTYFWRDRNVSTWANNAPTSLTPDGQDWLGKNFSGATGGGAFPGNAVIGATRVFNELWFGWSAGTNSSFPQAHVEMAVFDRLNNFNKIRQVQIWNPDYAFAYPALSTNACSQEVGLSLEFGGGGNYENHVVGFWGDFVVFLTSASNVGTNRFGDYVSIRRKPPSQANPGNLFDAFGYGLNTPGVQTDIRYVSFGRPASSCIPIPDPDVVPLGSRPVAGSGPAPERGPTIREITPHPITSEATVVFVLARRGRVRATLYDLQGRAVRTLMDEVREPGAHELRWARSSGEARLSPGAYLLALATDDGTASRRVIVLE